VRLNRWLADEGFLRFSSRGGLVARAASALRGAALRAIPEAWQARCFRLAGGRLASRLESGVRFGGIDWDGTQAFSEELNYFPSVWLNVQGRDRRGQVPVRDYRATCDAVRSRLLAWRDPVGGGRVVRRVWQRDELYHGPCVAMAPDLVLEYETPAGYSFVGLPSGGGQAPAVVPIAATELGGKLAGMSGSHRPNGIVALRGPGIAAARVSGVEMVDLAPTILALCGVAAPADWDGRALALGTELEPACVEGPWPGGEVAYGAAESAELERRLEQLGYLA
jgi:predicted AlkP superfamily phosphohydrolase/phosphomutase